MTVLERHSMPLLKSQRSSGVRRKGSFSDVEKYFLRALLLDIPENKPVNTLPKSQRKSMDDGILFQLPFNGGGESMRASSNKFGRHEKKLLGLWQAHEDGVHPVIMHKRRPSGAVPPLPDRTPSSRISSRKYSDKSGMDDSSKRSSVVSAAESIKTDVEVRPQEHDDGSSWGEDDGGFVHYNAWEVLNDEYAEDFGYGYKETIDSISATLADDDDCQTHVFRILGTSADDPSAQPHVLSPPLMDSLLNFVPDSLSKNNFWLKFSLLRDGASLYTLKQYIKASPYTILAIETTKGDVFGAFTSHIWRNHPTFYGNVPAFLWRMRQNRRTPCHSLFEQAHMESEIDCYPYSGLNDLVQVCSEELLAIGGGGLKPDYELSSSPFEKRESTGNNYIHGIDMDSLEQGQGFGFGICLDDDLLGGTTSPCGTFRNPCLMNHMSKGEVFEVANLEMWTLTPCADVKSAEKMELTRYFVEESLRSVTSNASSTTDIHSNTYGATQDEFQRNFYRRVGHNEPTRHQRKGSYEYRHIVAPTGRR